MTVAPSGCRAGAGRSSASTSPSTTNRSQRPSMSRAGSITRRRAAGPAHRGAPFLERLDHGVEDDAVVPPCSAVAAPSRRETHLDAVGARGRDVLADVIGPDRDGAMAAVDQHRELDRRRPAALPQRGHRALHGPSAVDHVVDQHDRRAPSTVDSSLRRRRSSGSMPLAAVDVERRARRPHPGFALRSDRAGASRASRRG